ncbi:hypothetical protein ORIO_12590 [Cereibacter azotoformans]|uniref:hypothetical protein n=1 Tax=Cereibacter azotoformans TaxID=43057 RepID=UPI001EECA818|nr:hypothetical protein [Cereibacter azotoformans]ULB10741.1 hypothetical protein ORIO_12590 [Cereibacter azotoformans]
MPLTLTPGPNPPTLTNPATFEVDTSAILAWWVTTVAEMSAQKVLILSDILGTVSFSGGVPNGKIIERNSNANGEYVRFADGTQICTHSFPGVAVTTSVNSGSLYSGSVPDWTFPAAFVLHSGHARGGRLVNAPAGVAVHLPYGSATSATSIRAYATASVASTDVAVWAFGRWR